MNLIKYNGLELQPSFEISLQTIKKTNLDFQSVLNYTIHSMSIFMAMQWIEQRDRRMEENIINYSTKKIKTLTTFFH